VPILLAALMPWAVFLPGAAMRTFPWRWRQRAGRPGELLMWLAIVLVVLFFSLSRSKLVHYVLPALAPAAVVMSLPLAGFLANPSDRLFGWGLRWLAATELLILAGVGAAARWLGCLDGWFVAWAASAVALLVLTWLPVVRPAERQLACCLAAAAVVFLGVSLDVAPAAYRLLSCRDMALAVKAQAGPYAEVCSTGGEAHSFSVYAARESVPRYRLHRPADEAALTAVLKSPRPTYCLIRPDQLDQLNQAVGGRLTVLATNGALLVVTNVGNNIGTASRAVP
jgi:hypothetical protein